MNKQSIIISLLAISALTAATALQAQTQPTEEKRDTVVTFNALDYSMQKRYLKHGLPFVKNDWKANTFVNMSVGYHQIMARGEESFNGGPLLQLGVGRQLNRMGTMRLGLFYGSNQRKEDNETLSHIGLDLDYLLNLSSFINGYNPGRAFELSLLAGIGGHYSSLMDEGKIAGDLHAGLQLKYHPGNYFDFYLEPRVGFATTGLGHSAEADNWHQYDMTYGVNLGINYRFKAWKRISPKARRLDGERFLNNTFINYGMGASMQLSDMVSELGAVKSMGPSVQLAVGKWISPYMGMRVGFFSQADTWHKQVTVNGEIAGTGTDTDTEGTEATDAVREEFYEMSTYQGGRLELMFNLLEPFIENSLDRRFGLSLLAGGEVGGFHKVNHNYAAKGGYMGLTSALHLQYRLSKSGSPTFDDVSVFVEPRFSTVNYNMTGSGLYKEHRVVNRYTDKLFSINVGLEMRLSNDTTRLMRLLNRELFRPSFFVTAGGGGSIPIQLKRYNLKRYFDYMAGVGLGYHFTPLSSVRLTGDFSPFSLDLKDGALKYNVASVGLDYMLNLTTLMGGYEPKRKLDVHLFAGIVGSMRLKPSVATADDGTTSGDNQEGGDTGGDTPETRSGFAMTRAEGDGTEEEATTNLESGEELMKSRTFFGAELGLHITRAITPKISVYLEPKVRIYGQELLMHNNVAGADMMMSLQVGARYKF